MEDIIKLEKQELSKEEMISILGTAGTSVFVCPECGSTNVIATKNVPPYCMCLDCQTGWQTAIDEDGGFVIVCGLSCQPGCKKSCATGGKK